MPMEVGITTDTPKNPQTKTPEDPGLVTVLLLEDFIKSERAVRDLIFLNLNTAVHIYLFTKQFLRFMV